MKEDSESFEISPVSVTAEYYLKDKPDFLNNTDFIIDKPKPILENVISLWDGFMQWHEMNIVDFEKYFLNSAEKAYHRYKSGEWGISITKAQNTLIDMYVFDRAIYKRKSRQFFKARPEIISLNFKKIFKSFCMRHRITQTKASEILFRNENGYHEFVCDETSLSCKRFDRIMLEMHYADLHLIESMGREYVVWALRNKRRMPKGYEKKIKEYEIVDY